MGCVRQRQPKAGQPRLAEGIAPPAWFPYLGRAAALATASAVMLNTRRTVAAGVRT